MLLKEQKMSKFEGIIIFIFKFFFIIFLTILLTISYQTWEYNHSMLPRNKKGIAIVTKLVKKRGNIYNHHLSFSYNNNVYEVKHHQNNIKKKYKINQKVEVLYNPQQPERAILNIPEEISEDSSSITNHLISIISIVSLFSFFYYFRKYFK